MRDYLRRKRSARRLRTDMGAAFGVDAGLAQGIEFEATLEPRKAIFDGSADRLLVVSVTSMQARLASAKSLAELIERQAPTSGPELPLRWTA
nr:hypothetical protein [Limnobacter sp. SAORIC-690]